MAPKFNSALVATCMAIALTACGGGGSTGSSTGSTDSTAGGGSSSGGGSNSGGGTGGGGSSGGGGGSAQVEKPSISTQPAAQSVISGATAQFSVSAKGTEPFTYQWKKNGTHIDGATGSTYTTPATRDADIGTALAYSVAVTNSAGSVTSSDAALTVSAAAVVITKQPAALTVATGAAASLSVEASGTSPSYQWKKNGTNIASATGSSYTIPATSFDDNGDFSVVVSNSAGTVTSSVARLTVTSAPVFASNLPAALSVNAREPATFSVTAVGTAPLAYQWMKATVLDASATPITYNSPVAIEGATSSSYTIPLADLADSGAKFSVVVSNTHGTVTSDSAKLTVNRYSLVANASGGFYEKTECVKDNVNGLIWEGKNPTDPNVPAFGTAGWASANSTAITARAANAKLTNYFAGAGINDSTNSLGYVNHVNTIGLCGFDNWRMPTKDELFGLFYSKPTGSGIGVSYFYDTDWFVNAADSWTSISSVPGGDSSCCAYLVSFPGGVSSSNLRAEPGNNGVRLVRPY